jgi:uncharacterized UPF0160 family protein
VDVALLRRLGKITDGPLVRTRSGLASMVTDAEVITADVGGNHGTAGEVRFW